MSNSEEAKESEQFPGVWFWRGFWWFEDETQNFTGPFNEAKTAHTAMVVYVDQL
jgi:hypothetical protein